MSVIQVLCQMQRYRDKSECLSLRGSQSRGGIVEFISVPIISLTYINIFWYSCWWKLYTNLWAF